MTENNITEDGYYRNPKLDLPRTCIICGIEKDPREFYDYRHTAKNGRKSIRKEPRCNPCKIALQKERQARKKLGMPVRHRRVPSLPTVEKLCGRCKNVKPVSEFYPKRYKKKDGSVSIRLEGYCKLCSCAISIAGFKKSTHQQETRRRYKIANREHSNTLARKRIQSNPRLIEQRRKNRVLWGIKNPEASITYRALSREHRVESRKGKPRRQPAARIKGMREDVRTVLDLYCVDGMYWDVYDSCLISDPTIDHIEPLFLGGTNVLDNLTVTSLANNSSKRDTPLTLWMLRRRQAEDLKK